MSRSLPASFCIFLLGDMVPDRALPDTGLQVRNAARTILSELVEREGLSLIHESNVAKVGSPRSMIPLAQAFARDALTHLGLGAKPPENMANCQLVFAILDEAAPNLNAALSAAERLRLPILLVGSVDTCQAKPIPDHANTLLIETDPSAPGWLERLSDELQLLIGRARDGRWIEGRDE